MSKLLSFVLIWFLIPMLAVAAVYPGLSSQASKIGDKQFTVLSRPELNLQIQQEAANAVRLSWAADPQAAGYYLYRADQPLPPGDSGWGLPDFVTVTSTWFYVSEPAEFYYVTAVVPPPPEFILVPGSTFSPTPDYTVTLSPFLMDRYEVTQGSFQSLMGWLPSNLSWGSGPDHPVYYCSWFNAIEYCNRRSIAEGLTPCYSYGSYGTDPNAWPAGWNTAWANHALVVCDFAALGYRLPTEMEWMFAAVGGNLSQGYDYSGGDVLGLVGWYRDNTSVSHIGGLKQPNELGFCDLSGNVYEWCWDRFDFNNQDYPSGSATDPTGPETGNGRRLRGGAWGSYDYQCTVEYRSSGFANSAGQQNGFRLVRRMVD